MHVLLIFAFLCLALLTPPLHAQQTPPITTSSRLTLDGIDLQYPYTVQLSLDPLDQGRQRIQAQISAPLNPLLPVLQQVLDRQRPRDNCAGYRGDNWVVGSPSVSFAIQGETLRLKLAADVDMWQCIENPFGRPFKNKVGGAVDLELIAAWQLQDQQLGLSVDVGQIKVRGDLGRIAQLWASTQGESIRDAARQRLRRESMPNWELPQALLALGAKVQSARFAERDGQPVAELVLHAGLSPANWLALQRRFWSTPGESP
jgi:hypothetical protein